MINIYDGARRGAGTATNDTACGRAKELQQDDSPRKESAPPQPGRRVPAAQQAVRFPKKIRKSSFCSAEVIFFSVKPAQKKQQVLIYGNCRV